MTTASSPTATIPDSLLIGCYTDDQGTGGIRTARADEGRVRLGKQTLTLRNPSWLVGFGEYVLACCELPHSALAVTRRTDKGLELVSQAPTHGADACHLAVSPDGRWIAVANYTSGQVSLFAAPLDGRIEEPTAVHGFTGSGPVAGRQDAPHAHQITWLDETHFLVSDLGSDMLRVMRVDEGALVELAPVALPAGHGPRHLVVRPTVAPEALDSLAPQLQPAFGTEIQVAVGGELSGNVVTLRHEGIAWDEGWWVLGSLPASQDPAAAQPSGLRLFGDDLVLANRVVNTVSLLRWPEDGSIHLVGESPCGGDEPRDLVEHAGLVWVANQHGSTVTTLRCTREGFEQVSSTPVATPASLLFGA